jgi:hypothetical protein
MELPESGSGSGFLTPGSRPPGEKTGFVLAVLFLYCIVELTGLAFHELWSDEIHAWALVTGSNSLAELLGNKIYEGHPDLWFLVLYGLKLISRDPAVMMIFHSLVAIATVFLLLRYSPFTRIQKILLVFGYYFLFEYAVISRNYAIEVLFLILFLIFYKDRDRKFLRMAILLFLMMQTNVYGIMLAAALTGAMAFEAGYSPPFRRALLSRKIALALSLLILAAGFAWSILSVLPQKDSYITAPLPFGAITLQNFLNSVGTVWCGIFPLPDPVYHFWNTNIVHSVIARALLSVAVLVSLTVLFRKRPVVLFLFSAASFGMLFFIFDFYTGLLRHHGHFFLLLIACLWIRPEYADRSIRLLPHFFEKYHRFMAKHLRLIVTILFFLHAVAGIFCLAMQVRYPFDAGRRTAEYIRGSGLDRFLVAGDWDWSAGAVAGHLEKGIYFLARDTAGTYVVLNNRRRDLSPDGIIRKTDSLAATGNDPVVLVLNYRLPQPLPERYRMKAAFTNSIYPREKFFVYLVSPRGLP